VVGGTGSGNEETATRHGIARARHGDGSASRVQEHRCMLAEVGCWRQVAGKGDVASVIQYRPKGKAVGSAAGRRVPLVGNRLDFAGGGFHDVHALGAEDAY